MSKKRRSFIEQINGQQGVNAQQTRAANNAAQKSKRVIAQKNIKEQGAAAPSMRERVIASQPISAPSVDERNYLQAAQRFFSAFGPQGAARQAADYAAHNTYKQYEPMANGDPTSKAMDAYYATRPATEDTIAAASMAGWQLTPQQWNDILSGRAYIPDVTGWEYFTHDRDAREAVERSVAEGAAFLDMGQDAGVFDTEGFLTPSNLNLASSEYISSMAGEYENMLANRDAAWNYPANLQWAAAVGNKGANWTIDMATEAMRVYNDDREFYEQYGPEGYYVALRDYADTMNVSQEGWDNIIGGVLVDMLKLNHVANGYDLATFDEAAALDELENLPEEEFYAFFNTWLPAFSGDQLGYETINWAQPGGLSSMFYAQGRRLPYMYTELQNREEYDQVVADIQAQIVSEGYSLTPDMFTQVEAEINEAYGGRIGDNTSYGYLMTPEEKTIYAYLRDMDPTGQEAKDYMELLMQTELYTRRSLANRAETTLYATDKAFAVPTFLNTGAALVGDVLSIPEKLYHAVTGTDNANAPWHDTTHYRSDVRGVQGEAIEEAGGDFWGPILRGGYDTAAGALDFGVSLALGKALGAIGGATGIGNAAQIAQSATGTIMGLSAGSANLTETAGTEMPATWRVISAATAYTVEGFTEKYSIEALFDDPTDFVTYWRNTFISGATEEMASDILNTGFQFVSANITGIMPDLVEQYNELASNGQADAFTQVLTDAMTQLFYTGVIGGLSEGVIATPTAVASAYTNYTTGRAINNAGGQDRLIELGMAMREGTEANALATALGRRAETTGRNGQPLRIPTSRLGLLYRTMLSETAEQYHDDVHQMGVESVADAIAQRYSDLGLENEMETRYTTEELAEAIVKTAETGTEPGGAIGRYIREHRVTAEIMREFREGGSPWAETMRTRQAAAGLQAQMRAAQIKATKIKAEGGTETETNTETDADAEVTHEGIMTDEGIEAETTEEVRRLTRRMSTSELLSRSIVLGLEGGAEEQTELVRVERTGDGLSLVVDRGGEEVNVGLDEVAQVSGAGVARVLAYAQERKEVTAQEINDMIGLLETSGEGFKSSRLISLYESALNAGFFGEARDTLNYLLEGAGEATDAMRAVLEVGYRQGQMQQSQAEENRLRRRADKETTGKSKLVSFMGDVGADFKGIDTGVRRSVHELMGTMDEAQEAAVDVIGQVAKAVGVQVVLYRTMAENGQKVDAPNGFYDAASNAIFVDINSGIAQGGQELVNYTVMHTFAHELTHYIEHNAADGYKTLRGLVQTVMAAKDGETNYAGLVMNKLREGTNLTSRAAAEAEVIADACELMLRNTTAIKTLAEQDVTLAAKVRNFVANFAAKIRRAFAGLVLNTKESALLTEMRDGVITYVDGLQAAWDNALIEAANRNRVRSEMTGQNQTDGTQQGKLSESEGINAELEEPMKLEAPSKDWHPELDEGWDRSKMPRLVTRGGEVQENAVDMAAEQGSTETEDINAESEAPRLPVVPRGDGVLERIAWIDSSKAPRLVTRGGEVQQATADAEAENAAGLAEAYDSQITRAATGEGMSRTFEGWATEPGQGAMPFDRDTTLSMAAEIARAATEVLNTLQSPDQLGDDANADAMTQAEETARQSALDAAREMVNSVYEGNDAAIREKLTELAGNVAEEAVNAWMAIRARVAARAARAEKATQYRIRERDVSYSALIDKHDMALTRLSDDVGSRDRKAIVRAGYNNALSVGIPGKSGMPAVYVEDIDGYVHVSKRSLEHGLDRRADEMATSVQHVGELLKNAVLINIAAPKLNTANESYILMSAGLNDDGVVSVTAFIVNRFTNEIESIDVLKSLKTKRNQPRITAGIGAKALLPTGSTISIAELIESVKNEFADLWPDDVLSHLGIQRRESEITSKLKYSERRPSNVSIRNALKNMRETADMSETEKILLRKYKEDLAEFEGYQEQINQLVEEMKAEQTEEEKKKNKNRMQVLKVKQRRVHGRLTKAESSEGFARMMATTAGMIRMFVRNDSIQEAAEDASRRLNEIADELNRLNATFDRTKRWEMQRVMQSIYDPKALDEAAVGLKSMFNSNMSKTAIKERLVSLSMAMISGTNVDGLTPLQQAEKLARDLRTGTVIDEGGILEMLRENLPTIEINNAMREELNARGISLQSFKSVVGKVAKVVYKKDGNSSGLLAQMEADTYYRENGALHAFFGEIINDADAYAKLYDTVSNVLTSGDRIYEGRYGEETMQGDIVAVLDAMSDAKMLDAGVETVQAVYDAVQRTAQTDSRLAERIAELKRKSAGTNVIAKKVAGELSDIGIEAPMVAKYYATLEAERRLLTEQETTEEIRKRMEGEMGAWYQERQLMDELRKTRGNIRRMVGWMDKRIRKEKAGKLVQEELKPVVEEMVRILLKAQGEEIFQAFNEKELGEIARVYTALHALDGDNTKQMNELLRRDMQQTLDNLKYDLKQLGEVEEDTRIARMNAEYNILAQIEDLITEIWHAVNETNNLYIEGRKVQLEVVGEKMGRELRSKGRHSIKDSLGGKAWQTLTRFVRDGNITPPYFFRLLGVDTLSELNSGLLSAQSRYARMKDSAEAKIAELQKKYNYWEWKNNESLTFTTELGQRLGGDLHKITLTVDEALSLWAIWQREMGSTPLFTSTHLAKGGFVLESKQRKVNGRIETDSTAHKLSTLDMQTINNWLTPEMKEYAKKVVEYMSKDMAAVGNQTSMHLYGVKKFKEQKYFPMRTQRDQLVQSSDAGAKAENDSNRLAHKSFTKPRVNMAATPLQVGSFTATAAGHINDMLLYGTFAEPIEAFNSVLNYMVTEMDGDDTNLYSIRSMFEQAFGADMKKYLESYLADANGGVRPDKTSTEVVANKMLSTFKKTATMASLSVAAQQPMAIIRAATEIDLKYFTAGRITKKEYEQLRKYSGTALIKESGGFDMTGTRSMAEQIMGTPEEDYKLWQTFKSAFGVGTPKGERAAIAGRQWDKLFGLAAQKADQATWTYLWGVVKAEMADAHKGMNVNSPEFLELAGKRFDEVVNLTQVYDSTLVRSPNMRSKGMMQYAMTFRAEPTLTLNLLLDAWRKQPDRAKKIVKASAIYIVSAIVTSLAAAIPSAGRDDEEKPWAEKLLEEWGNRLGGWGGNLNPAGLVPIVGDVMSIFDGYDVERADMAVIADMFKEIQRVGSGYYKDKPWKGVENAVGAVGNMLGIPAKNLWREARAAWNTVTGIINPPREMSTMGLMHDASLNYVVLPDRDNGYYFNRLYNSMQAGKTEDVERVTEFLTGVMGKKETAVKTGVKDVVKAKLLAGKITEAEAKAFLVKHGLVKDEKEAYKAVDEWLDKDANRDEAGDLPEDYEYTVFRGLYEALEGGNAQAIKAEMDKLTSNGWEADDVRDEIRKYVNKEYREGRMPQEEAKRLLQAYGEYTTYEDENDWYWHFEGQDYRTENGTESTFSRYGALHTAIDGGKATEIKAAVKQLTDNGYTEEKVQSEVYSYLGEQYMDGKISWEQLMNLAKKYGGKDDNDENDWYWEKRKYEYGKANGGKTTGYGQFSEYLDAVRTAKNLRNVTKMYLDHGVEKGTLKSQLRGAFREEYRTLYRTNRTQFANLRANLVNALVVMGETRDKAMKYLDGWLED